MRWVLRRRHRDRGRERPPRPGGAELHRAIADKISAATNAALADAELRKIVVAAGLAPVEHSSPEATRQFLRDDIAKWTPLIKKIGLQIG